MKDDDKKTLNRILAKIDNGDEIDNQVENVRLNDPIGELRTALFNFFQHRLTKVEDQDVFQKQIETKLIEKMEDDKLSVSQMIALYTMLNSESTLKTDSLMNIARGKESAIIPLSQSSEDDNPNGYKILSPIKRADMNELKIFIKDILEKEEE